MDLQYATVDQLAEITDTMVSLRDAILGLSQMIYEHQVPPVRIQGTTPHDYSTPPLHHHHLDLPYNQTT